MSASVRIKPLGEAWQTLGTGRFRGVTAEEIQATSNQRGPDQLTFQVKIADPATLRSDLLPYAPVELEVDGMRVWAGRVIRRPSSEQDLSVQCEGWQYHLDDGALSRVFVHTRASDYRDQRSFLTADLTKYKVSGFVTTENGTLVIGFPKNFAVTTSDCVGVTLDLGPDSTAGRVVMTWASSNNDGATSAIVRGNNSEDATVAGDDAISFLMNSGASGTSSGNFTTRRYIHIFLNYTGAGGTYGGDVRLRVTSIQLFRTTAYESGNASILKADSPVKDALVVAPMLNQSTGLITAGTFSIPEYHTDGYQSPRSIIESVNAYENYQYKIGGDDLRTLVYRVKPTTPLFEVGTWSGASFADTSITGEDIYTDAYTVGTDAAGGTLVSKRSQTGNPPPDQPAGYTNLYTRQAAESGIAGGSSAVKVKVLPISSAGTTAVYDRFGDLWLSEHRTAPFTGKLSATNGIRRHIGGASVPPHELLLHAGEFVNFSHRTDPDTGAVGRRGMIAGVTYTHSGRQVDIDIDDRRDHFEEILARYGILVDQLG